MSSPALRLFDEAGALTDTAPDRGDVASPTLSAPSRQHVLPPGFKPGRFGVFGLPAATLLSLALSVAVLLRNEPAPPSAPVALPQEPSQPSSATPAEIAIDGARDAAPVSAEVTTQEEARDFAPTPLQAAPRRQRTSSRTSKAERESAPAIQETVPSASAVPAPLPVEAPPDPLVQQAYRALLAGQANSAIDAYRSALARDARNCDALNGLGLIAAHSGDSREAARWFERCIAADPRNAYARIALTRLAAVSAPASAELGLRETLRRTPTDPSAHFALGNQFAQTGRWAEAQAAYFQASTLDQGNPDYLFNLAVALDQLGHASLAREQYGLALEAARLRPANFDRAAAAARRDILVATQP